MVIARLEESIKNRMEYRKEGPILKNLQFAEEPTEHDTCLLKSKGKKREQIIAFIENLRSKLKLTRGCEVLIPINIVITSQLSRQLACFIQHSILQSSRFLKKKIIF